MVIEGNNISDIVFKKMIKHLSSNNSGDILILIFFIFY